MQTTGLSQDELRQWESDGYVGPYTAYGSAEAGRVGKDIDRHVVRLVRWRSKLHRWLGMRRPDRLWRFQMTQNRHLDLPVVARICNLPSIVDRVAQLLGSDLVLWRTQFFLQSGKPGEGLGWHRDLYVNLLEPPRTNLSVHLALTEATEDNCVLILPGTHTMTTEQICSEHGLGLHAGRESNKQGSPQFTGAPKRASAIRRMPLRPGEFFVFNEALVHASSESGEAARARIAMGMRVTVPGVKVLPLAFADTLPKRHGCVMLRGSNLPGVNELLPWTS